MPRNVRSRNGTFFRQASVIRFLAAQIPMRCLSTYGVALGVQDVDPGCTKHQARHALDTLLAEGFVQLTTGCHRALLWQATDKGRAFGRAR